MWLRKVCSTVVTATWSSMAMSTRWLTIANGGSFLSSGIKQAGGVGGAERGKSQDESGEQMAHVSPRDQTGVDSSKV